MKTFPKFSIRLTLGFVTLLLWGYIFPLAIFSDPVDTFGGGSRSRAMGNTGVASADRGDAAYYNPAALVVPDRGQVEFGYIFADHNFKVDGRDKDVDNLSSVFFGTSMNLSRIGLFEGFLGRLISFGAFGYLPSKYLVKIANYDPSEPNFAMFGNRNNRFSVYSGLGLMAPGSMIGIPGFISIGVGTHALADLPINTDVNLISQKYPVMFDAVLKIKTALTLGGLVKLSLGEFDTRFGVSYRGGTDISIPLTARVNLLDREIASIYTIYTDLYTPPTLSFGIGLRYNIVRLSSDITYMFFEKFKFPFLGNLSLQPQQFPSVLTSATPQFVEPELKNTFVPKVGFELTPRSYLALRLGYYLWSSPIPQEQKGVILLDSSRHTISLGVGFNFRDPIYLLKEDIKFDITSQYFILSNGSVKTTVSDNKVKETQFEGNLWSVGASLSLAF